MLKRNITPTKEKLKKLRNLKIKNPKIKKLLKRAIEGWSQPEVKIRNGGFGCNLEGVERIEAWEAGCCLMGAAILGMKIVNKWNDNCTYIWAVSGFSSNEISDTYRIFDYIKPPTTEFEKEIASIRDIVFA